MDNNILELDDKMLFIKFAYFSFTKVEVFFRVWWYGTSDLKRKRFRAFFAFFKFFSTFCGPKGGRMEDSLRRASRIRVFPRNATNDRIMSKAAKNIENCFTPQQELHQGNSISYLKFFVFHRRFRFPSLSFSNESIKIFFSKLEWVKCFGTVREKLQGIAINSRIIDASRESRIMTCCHCCLTFTNWVQAEINCTTHLSSTLLPSLDIKL